MHDFKDLEKDEDLKKNANVIDRYKLAVNNFIKIFDSHYLQYISYQKQRDLMIINNFYKLILKDVKIDKKLMRKYEFSDLVECNGVVNFDNVTQMNSKETIVFLEYEISILKAFYKFYKHLYEDLKKIFSNACIELKMQKVKRISGDNIFNMITVNRKVRKQITDKIGVVKKYSEIKVNLLFTELLRNQFLILCKK